jgi:FtsZ-interacting cell division protein ZipA
MSTTGIVVTIVVVLVIALIALLVWQAVRRKRLQQRFGPEYDRAVQAQPDRAAAEHELRAREHKHAALELTELDPDEQQRYAQQWLQLQSWFVDDPRRAVTAADELITNVMHDRGYPSGEFDDRVASLSVEHARTLDHYRSAHEVSIANQRGEASTEQLRQAIVHYRALASDLLGPITAKQQHPAGTDPAATTSTTTTTEEGAQR